MYPFFRLALETWLARRAPPLGPMGTHVSHHRIWPWDLDPWVELNNGRTLTQYDLGRLPYAIRIGLVATLRRNRWRMTVAGVSVRYRRRVVAFQRVEMRTRALGWDSRFIYIEQSLWRGDECANQMLMRAAVLDSSGIVPPSRAMAAMGVAEAPDLPDWVAAWIEAEAIRPWPPEKA